MKIQLAKMKADLKVLALEIKRLKSLRKSPADNNGCGLVHGLLNAQITFRSGHIAYCILRGRTMEQIEPKLKDPNGWHNVCARREAMRIVASTLEAVNAAKQP